MISYPQNLDRNMFVQIDVCCSINLAEGPFANNLMQLITFQDCWIASTNV